MSYINQNDCNRQGVQAAQAQVHSAVHQYSAVARPNGGRGDNFFDTLHPHKKILLAILNLL